MATTTAPLLSFGASGAIAKTQVYSSWRGVPYVRRHVVPANPRSTAQTATRTVFAWASNIWKQSPSILQAPWTLFAQGQPLTDRNAFQGQNTKALRPGTDLAAFIASPGAKGGLGAVSVGAVGGAGQVTVTVTAPTAPAGWTIVAAHAVALVNADPHVSTNYTVGSGSDNTAPYSIVITGLAPGSYQCAAWLEWTKPDGSSAFGPSKNATATVT